MSTPRHRTRNSTKGGMFYTTVYDGVETAYEPIQYLVETEETMDDVVDPGFHGRRGNGEVFCNPCLYTVTTRTCSTERGQFRYWWLTEPDKPYVMTDGNLTLRNLRTCAYFAWDQYTGPDLDVGKQVDMSKHYALAQVDSTPYEFMEDLAEIGETIQFLKSPLQSLKKLARAYKRRKYQIDLMRDVKAKARAYASLWRQYRFAAAPLVRSIMSAAEVLANYRSIERPPRRSAHGFSEYSVDPKVETFEPWTVYGTTQFVRKYEKTSTASVEAHAAIYYEVSNPLVDWNFALGLRLKDIPTTAWEVVPLSFMVDRLIGIKNMITGLVNLADPTVTFLAGSVTTRTNYSVENHLVGMYDSYNAFLHFDISQTDKYTISDFTYDRNVWKPQISDTLPRFTPKKLVEDVTSILDLLSIIIGKFS